MYPKVYSWDKQETFPIAVAKLCRGTPVIYGGVSETTEVNQDESCPL